VLITGSKGVAKHLFSDMPTAATETSAVTMPKMYGKPCRHGLSYGNLKSTVFRLCWAVTCASRPPAALHQEELAAHNKAFAEAELNLHGRFDLDMNSRLARL
jgi:hypothetical protein